MPRFATRLRVSAVRVFDAFEVLDRVGRPIRQAGRPRYLLEKSGSHSFAAVSNAVAVSAAMGAAGFVQFRNEAGFH